MTRASLVRAIFWNSKSTGNRLMSSGEKPSFQLPVGMVTNRNNDGGGF